MADNLMVSGSCAILGSLTGDIGLLPLLSIVGVLILVAFCWLALWRPALLARALLWLPMRILYRLRVLNRENIPPEGPVLMVSNHVSFIDAFLIFVSQKRPVRFVIWAHYTRLPGVRHLFRWARVIPIDGSAGPRAIVQSLRLASEALAAGDVVCIFAEGGITRTGALLPFHRGIEQILKRSPAPVVPVCLDHIWGSIFSYRGGRFLWKFPQKIPYPAVVSFGKPLPPSVTAAEVRQAIQRLSAESAILRKGERRPVHRQFVRMAARHPFRVGMIDPLSNGKIWRYGEILAGTKILSGLLRPLLERDEMVGLWLPPSTAAVFSNIAMALLRKVPVNLNYTLSGQATQSAIKQCNLRHVITSKQFTAKVPLDAPGVEFIYLEDFRKSVSKWQRIRSFLAVALLPAFVLDRWVLGLGSHRLDDLATVIFSSGSTGDPKGVMLTHSNLAANAESVIQAIDPGPKDRVLGILPFFHSFGFTVTFWAPLQVGASLIYHADPRQAKETGDLCRKYRCTIYLTTPTFLRFCLKRCNPGDFSTVRILMCGAEKLPQSLAKEFQEKFGVQALEGYGCTELSPVACANLPDWQEGSARQVGNKLGTIGQPVPGVAAAIVHPETFEPVPLGSPGLLTIYGANVMKGYLGKPELTQQVIRAGWYMTGDMATIDDEGFITLTGRLARFSKIGGEMVPHQKVEEELQAILGTSERACVVTAVPDERRGERLIVLHAPLNGLDIGQLCRQLGTRGLPNLWLPGEKDFFEVAELPILGTGKIDLKLAKEIAASKTGLATSSSLAS